MAADDLVVTRSLTVPASELQWRFTRSGGPGGQHANTADTRAEVRFDVAGSPSLDERQRALLLDRLGAVVRAASGDERSQARNRVRALERLAERLADALVVDAPRRPTRPGRGAVVRRLDEKRRNAQRKAGRRLPPDD